MTDSTVKSGEDVWECLKVGTPILLSGVQLSEMPFDKWALNQKVMYHEDDEVFIYLGGKITESVNHTVWSTRLSKMLYFVFDPHKITEI